MNKDINILILSCGTRNKIVQYFKKELAGKGQVMATDCSKLAPALYDADKYFIVPRIDEEGYIDIILSNGIRLTKFGRFLRSTSLDELPELFNILKGDMSVIGPRPLLVEYLPLYNEHQQRRHEVRPGLSGLAQISGRNAISWEDKFNLDVEYVDNISFLGDWKIIFFTLKKVFIREGINQTEEEPMEDFKGTT